MQDNQVYKISRPIYSFESLSNVYCEENLSFNLLQSIKNKTKIRKPSLKSILQIIFPFPFIMASFYSYKFLLYDLIAGFTMVVFHIPQGMAYGLLAGLKPINGLYTSFFPPLVYILFGTSRHLSIGTFSIMALLSSVPVLREAKIDMANQINDTGNFSTYIGDEYELSKLQISIATTLLAGIFQVFMGFFRLGCIMNYINDALIGGFTCGTSFHVVISQMGPILGYSVKRYSGLGEFPYKLFLFAKGIKSIHWITVVISIICIVFLVIFTEVINPRIQKKIKVTFPAQLFIVIVATFASYYLSFSAKNVKVVGPIPKGLPQPIIPDVTIWPRIFVDSLLLGLVGFVMNSAISKTYALKFSYDIAYNQESVAFGLANIFGSMFQCTMSAGALARTAVVVEVGMKSQLTCFVSCFCMVFILLFIGPLFQHVPTCVLSAIIVVSLKSMFMQLRTLPELYRLSKFDFNIWIVAFVSTILSNVPYGLVMGFLFSLLTIITRLQNPSSQILGQLPNTNLYQDIKEYKDAAEIPGVKIFRFNAPFYFANAEIFQSKLYRKTGINPLIRKPIITKMAKDIDNIDIDAVALQSADDDKLVASKTNQILLIANHDEKSEIPADQEIKFIIIDCSSVNYVDNVALRVLGDIYNSYRKMGISVYFAGPNYKIRRMFMKAKLAKENLKGIMFVTVHDAVLNILYNNDC